MRKEGGQSLVYQCRNCEATVTPNNTRCPFCGISSPARKAKARVQGATVAQWLVGLLLAGAIWFGLSSLEDDSPPTTRYVKVEVDSIQDCLEFIARSSGETAARLLRDKPDEVLGELSNGKQFGCTKKETGTKGTYFEAWYYSPIERSPGS